MIARAVLNSPEIILADEPTGNLDSETGHAIAELLHGISEAGALVVMTTHTCSCCESFPARSYRCADHLMTDVTAEYAPAITND